ncbi:MAG TPA: hypothetical protein VK698_30450, partial [Kofleriaceae bacterium]|nr:hypothetical protein [Kofleriaceae bacterium]
SLHEQARTQRLPFDAIASLGIHRAMVMAPPFITLVNRHPVLAQVGTWVFQYPPPDPFLRDDVIFVRPTADPAALRALYPDRTLYAMTYDLSADPPIRLELVEPSGSHPLEGR